VIVCPHCKTEHFAAVSLCSSCGADLSSRRCNQCQAIVKLEALHCYRCGTPNAPRLRAIVIPHTAAPPLNHRSQPTCSPASASPPSNVTRDAISPDSRDLATTFSRQMAVRPNPAANSGTSPAVNSGVSPATHPATDAIANSGTNSTVTSPGSMPPAQAAAVATLAMFKPFPGRGLALGESFLDPQQRYRILPVPPTSSHDVRRLRLLAGYSDRRHLDSTSTGTLSGVSSSASAGTFADKGSEGWRWHCPGEQEYAIADLKALQTPYYQQNARHSGGAHRLQRYAPLELNPWVQPYLADRGQPPSAYPQLYDAWQTPEHTIILVVRRHLPEVNGLLKWTNTTSQPLQQQWHDRSVSILQKLYWMYQMLELWGVLAALTCRPSLLIPDNILLDEDHSICLERFVAEGNAEPPTIGDLAHLWKTLDNGDTEETVDQIEPISYQLSPIQELIDDIEQGRRTTPEAVRKFLEVSLIEAEDSHWRDDEEATWFTDSAADLANEVTELSESDDHPRSLETTALEVHLEAAGATDAGQRRRQNEDVFMIPVIPIATIAPEAASSPPTRSGANPESPLLAPAPNPIPPTIHAEPSATRVEPRGLYVLCDGMGGHAGGEIASRLASQTFIDTLVPHWQATLPDTETLSQSILTANQAVYRTNQQNHSSGFGRMGTTFATLLVQGKQVMIAHVGDSRIYRYTRSHGLEQLTTDHDVGQQAIQQGVDPALAYRSPTAYRLTQALGPYNNSEVNPDIATLEIEEDTLFLLASDGLTDNDVVERSVLTHIQPFLNPATSLDRGVQRLIDLANLENGHDNITVILVRITIH